MPKQVQAWKCNYCNAVTLDAQEARRQEEECLFNPAHECCDNCVHLVIATMPRFGGNDGQKIKVCQMPPDSDTPTQTDHAYGWCANWERNPFFERRTEQ